MPKTSQPKTKGRTLLHSYAIYGLMGGLCLGLVVGVVVSGPHFSEWPVSRALLVIFGSGFGGSLFGYILAGLAVGFVAGGSDDLSAYSDASTESGNSDGCDGDGGSCVS